MVEVSWGVGEEVEKECGAKFWAARAAEKTALTDCTPPLAPLGAHQRFAALFSFADDEKGGVEKKMGMRKVPNFFLPFDSVRNVWKGVRKEEEECGKKPSTRPIRLQTAPHCGREKLTSGWENGGEKVVPENVLRTKKVSKTFLAVLH